MGSGRLVERKASIPSSIPSLKMRGAEAISLPESGFLESGLGSLLLTGGISPFLQQQSETEI